MRASLSIDTETPDKLHITKSQRKCWLKSPQLILEQAE